MTFELLSRWERLFEAEVARTCATLAAPDPAHDLLHFRRVVKTAKHLAGLERAKLEVVAPAAWLHDYVIVPKNDPRRSMASRLSAEGAVQFLALIGYPTEHFADIAHAIECHSFSANIAARTLEAKIVQDADRLDGLGAIGIARCFSTAGSLGTTYYDFGDPLCKDRAPDDKKFAVDHFYKKLFRVVEMLQTDAGRQEGKIRAERMKRFLDELRSEI